jgi:hypothetical protein
MNHDHARMTAKISANPCGLSNGRVSGVSYIAASARRSVAVGMLAWSVFGAIDVVQAQDRGGWRRDDGQQQQQQQQPQRRDDHADRNGQRDDARSYEPRPDDSHRQQQDRNAEAQRRSGRLTADERRDLRRQINEAGVDLYPNTPRR